MIEIVVQNHFACYTTVKELHGKLTALLNKPQALMTCKRT